MRSPLKKLLVVVAPTFAAFAVAAGPASALTIASEHTCSKPHRIVLPADPSDRKADANGDGLVCVKTVGNGHGGVKDDDGTSYTVLP